MQGRQLLRQRYHRQTSCTSPNRFFCSYLIDCSHVERQSLIEARNIRASYPEGFRTAHRWTTQEPPYALANVCSDSFAFVQRLADAGT
jgi:hypothetical protein